MAMYGARAVEPLLAEADAGHRGLRVLQLLHRPQVAVGIRVPARLGTAGTPWTAPGLLHGLRALQGRPQHALALAAALRRASEPGPRAPRVAPHGRAASPSRRRWRWSSACLPWRHGARPTASGPPARPPPAPPGPLAPAPLGWPRTSLHPRARSPPRSRPGTQGLRAVSKRAWSCTALSQASR